MDALHKPLIVPRSVPFAGWLVLLLSMVLSMALSTAACQTDDSSGYTEKRERCADRNPLKNAYFGDLHAHTGYSFDAYVYGNHFEPNDLYRFAKGEPLALEPFDANGEGTRTVQLARPLDFAMASDHGEFFGEVALCTTPGSAGYDNSICEAFRAGGDQGVTFFGFQTALADNTRFDLCGSGAEGCLEDALTARWLAVQEAAETHYDRTSACSFVTFVGYEYTASTDVVNLHRNVIFRNANVIERPLTYYESPTYYDLWSDLRDECLDAGTGCDVMTIGHNSNLSNGNYFQIFYGDAETEQEEREAAALRARLEPVAEVFQHKGDTECRNGFDDPNAPHDPLCDNEKQWPTDAEECAEGTTGAGGMRRDGCVSRLDFLRNVLKEGLAEKERLGVNPYKLGLIAATDTHNAIVGKATEHDFQGHVGEVDDTPEKRLGDGNLTHDALINNPGGLTGVWAEEKSRDAIFSAVRRREVFGTSGPRMTVRLFGGWSYDAGLCDGGDAESSEERIRQGYDNGVPMGQDLPEAPASAGSPIFLLQAHADVGPPERPGVGLQRLQIIKGWLDSSGEVHEIVYDVAGDPDNGADVDLQTCTPRGDGADTLCAVWTDPDFDPTHHAFYYLRVLQNPTCRWSSYDCFSLPVGDRPPACEDPDLPWTVQERAWSSPIWYTP